MLKRGLVTVLVPPLINRRNFRHEYGSICDQNGWRNIRAHPMRSCPSTEPPGLGDDRLANMGPSEVAEFRERGFLVLRRLIDPAPLSEELDRAFAEGFRPSDGIHVLTQGTGQVSFRYLPMMCERTPVSLQLLDRLAVLAAELLGREVLPGRVKGTRYFGDTGWHRDSTDALPTMGFLAYLEPLTAHSGALRVLPGSHADLATALPTTCDHGPLAPGQAIETEPGDVIAFDEHLVHGSKGGRARRQWRADFLADPLNAEEEDRAQAYFAHIFPAQRRDAPYDATRYPSYGPYWEMLDRPWTTRLRHLGVYKRAQVAEGREAAPARVVMAGYPRPVSGMGKRRGRSS
jgi:Phytanoyl-CoA dioxygenase (PhyH)